MRLWRDGAVSGRIAGARATGVTLSREQHGVAVKRAIDGGLADSASFRLQDYRDVSERFDRIVSVGMFEHVGVHGYDEFFQHVSRLLKDDGVMLLHAIGRSGKPNATNPWIAKYIFPGGYIPSLSEVFASIERSGLYVTDTEILRLHYADTLKSWRERFTANRDEAKALYDERFCRMWEFYLAGSEVSFRVDANMVFQIQLAKKQDVVPATREPMSRRVRRDCGSAKRRSRRCGWLASESPPRAVGARRSARRRWLEIGCSTSGTPRTSRRRSSIATCFSTIARCGTARRRPGSTRPPKCSPILARPSAAPRRWSGAGSPMISRRACGLSIRAAIASMRSSFIRLITR